MNTAIVFDWTTISHGGAERVLEQIICLFPNSDLYCIAEFVPEDQRAFFQGKRPTTTFVQRLPFAKSHFRMYVPLFPIAIEQLDLRRYDLVISSSHAFAKGIITGPDQVHVCYCHSPIRSAWDMEQDYRASDKRFSSVKRVVSTMAFHYIRMWDVRTSNGVDQFVANSRFIARRIEKVYRRDSIVVYPPVDVEGFGIGDHTGDYYFASGRLTGYKRFDLLVDAFRLMPNRQLVVGGHGSELKHLRGRAAANVRFLGFQPFDELHHHLRHCRAFLFAGVEDFGIAMVEAQACGAPLICCSKGGARDIVVDGETGITFDEQTPEAVVDAIERFERTGILTSPAEIRETTHRFSVAMFRGRLMQTIDAAILCVKGTGVRRSALASGAVR
jgi:glycosyltransferase involved in cell wall biosynthesis